MNIAEKFDWAQSVPPPDILKPSLFNADDEEDDHHELGRNQSVWDGFRSTIREIISSDHYELSKMLRYSAKLAIIGAGVGLFVASNRHNVRSINEVLRVANSSS